MHARRRKRAPQGGKPLRAIAGGAAKKKIQCSSASGSTSIRSAPSGTWSPSR
jgi:hypothetical protein